MLSMSLSLFWSMIVKACKPIAFTQVTRDGSTPASQYDCTYTIASLLNLALLKPTDNAGASVFFGLSGCNR